MMNEFAAHRLPAQPTWFARLNRHRRWINNAALLISSIWFVAIISRISPAVDDFKFQWQASVNLMASGSPYATIAGNERNRVLTHEPGTGKRTLFYVYPPFLAYGLQPLGLLQLELAQWIWFGLNSVALALFIAICIRMSKSAWACSYWGVVVLATLLAPPTRLSLQLGQISIMLALMLVLSVVYLRAHPRIAGSLLAAATLIKLFPGFMIIYALMQRSYRQLGWACIFAAIVCGMLFLSYGITPYAAFFHILVEDNYYPYSADFNISIVAFWQRLFVAGPYGIPIVEAPWLALTLGAITMLAVLGCCLAARGGGEPGESGYLRACVWLCAMLLLTPANGCYNLVLMLFPCLVIMRHLEQHPDTTVRNWLILATALVCVPTTWNSFHPVVYQAMHVRWGLLALTPPLYGMCIYLALLTKLALRKTA